MKGKVSTGKVNELSDAFAAENNFKCREYDFHIGEKIHIFHIYNIVIESFNHFFERIRIAYFDGTPRCESGPNPIEQTVIGCILYYLINVKFSFGPGTHYTHVAPNYIYKLGNFIKPVFAHKSPHIGYAFVVGAAEFGCPFFGVNLHGSEFQHFERFAVKSDSFLFEYHGTFRIEFDGYVKIKS